MTAENEETKNANGSRTKSGTSARTAAGDGAKSKPAAAASKAKTSAHDAEKSAESGVRSGGEAMKKAAAGWETGRQAVQSTMGKAASTATTAWSVVKHRKSIAVGAAAGVGGLIGGAFALGRQTAKSHSGPITRFTGGRI